MATGTCSSAAYYGPQFRSYDFCAGLPEGRKDGCAVSGRHSLFYTKFFVDLSEQQKNDSG